MSLVSPIFSSNFSNQPVFIVSAVSSDRCEPFNLNKEFRSAPGVEIQSQATKPRIVACDDHVVLEIPNKSNDLLPIPIDDHQTACRLVSAGPWNPYPNRPGKEKYLRRSIRIGKRTTTEYAHDFLFGGPAAEDGQKVVLRPRDGNFFNLRRANFEDQNLPSRRVAEVERLLKLLDTAFWDKLTLKARRALGDSAKVDDAISAALDHVVADLVDGKGNFPGDESFVRWVTALLEVELRKRQHCSGDIVREGWEQKAFCNLDVAALGEGSGDGKRVSGEDDSDCRYWMAGWRDSQTLTTTETFDVGIDV